MTARLPQPLNVLLGLVDAEPTKRYTVHFLIVDADGWAIYRGTAPELTSPEMDLSTPDVGVLGAYYAITAQTLQRTCTQQPGVPAGRVVVTDIKEAGK